MLYIHREPPEVRLIEKVKFVLVGGAECAIESATALSDSERNYAQIEKEVLVLIFGVRKVPSIPVWSALPQHPPRYVAG